MSSGAPHSKYFPLSDEAYRMIPIKAKREDGTVEHASKIFHKGGTLYLSTARRRNLLESGP
jgi:hypothetical protein